MISFYMEPGYDVKKPEREFGNAGIDFFIPHYTDTFDAAFNDKNVTEQANLFFNKELGWHIEIKPHGRVNIPSGVRSRISSDIALEAQNKSGVATKHGLVYGASTVWKLEESIDSLIALAVKTLSDRPLFFLINSYTTGLSPLAMQYILKLRLEESGHFGFFDSQELALPVKSGGGLLPCGASVRWTAKEQK